MPSFSLYRLPMFSHKVLWKDGILLRDAQSISALVERHSSTEIRVTVTIGISNNQQQTLSQQQQRWNLLRTLSSIVTLLLDNYVALEATVLIPCPVCIGQKSGHYFTFSKCEESVVDGLTSFDCNGTSISILEKLAPEILFPDRPQDLKFDLAKDYQMEDDVILGEGSFAKVVKAIRKTAPALPKTESKDNLHEYQPKVGDVVAVKLLKIPHESEKLIAFRDWRHEVNILSRLSHPSIIRLVGYSVQPFALSMQLASLGTLYRYLHNEAILSIPWTFVIKVANDIALAMNYLHTPTTLFPAICHRDLKSPNVLVRN